MSASTTRLSALRGWNHVWFYSSLYPQPLTQYLRYNRYPINTCFEWMSFPMSFPTIDCIFLKMAPARFLVPYTAPPSRGKLYCPRPCVLGQDFVITLMDRIHGGMLHDCWSYFGKGITASRLSWDTNPWTPASSDKEAQRMWRSPEYVLWWTDTAKDLADNWYQPQTMSKKAFSWFQLQSSSHHQFSVFELRSQTVGNRDKLFLLYPVQIPDTSSLWA